MVCVASVRVQEDPFALLEGAWRACEGVLKRSAAEGRLIPREWIDAPCG